MHWLFFYYLCNCRKPKWHQYWRTRSHDQLPSSYNGDVINLNGHTEIAAPIWIFTDIIMQIRARRFWTKFIFFGKIPKNAAVNNFKIYIFISTEKNNKQLSVLGIKCNWWPDKDEKQVLLFICSNDLTDLKIDVRAAFKSMFVSGSQSFGTTVSGFKVTNDWLAHNRGVNSRRFQNFCSRWSEN